MTYEEALAYIHNTLKFGVKLGLQNMHTLLAHMGNPHRKLKYVHVGGTNGKGSTVAFISSILMAAGYKTGVYTSPYIQRFTERIRINQEEISQADLARITVFVRSKVDEMVAAGSNHPTEFEIVTAIAFQYFFEAGCDVVVLEVGLGGRFDSTNVIDTPLVSVITTISLDHTEYLGSTLPEIAFEKAGIVKENGDVLVYPQSAEVMPVFQRTCRERSARLHTADFSRITMQSDDLTGQIFHYGSEQGIKIRLLGDHQVHNAVVAMKAIEILQEKGLHISSQSLRQGLENASWPGRFEVMGSRPAFVIDGAHNPEGAAALSRNLRKYFPEKRILFILGVLRDKDYRSLVEAVAPIAWGFITVTPDSPRAMNAQDLAEFIKSYCKNVWVSDTIEDAVGTSLFTASSDDVVCAFGSLYYIGRVRETLGR